MANINFAERENAGLHPLNLKMRQRLQSAPERLLSPMNAKTFHTPLAFGRKAFGAVNKKISTPVVNTQEKLKPQEMKVKHASLIKVEEYPDIEKFIPYDPLEFEKYSVPEDLIPLGGFALPGLACFPPAPRLCEDDLEMFEPLSNQSPVKMPKCSDHYSELDAFLQTLDELTVELPPEPFTD
ncbi:securin [Anarrhichthys ocellatus]|uniref:securin n=1 Tax=Anarrhichthys ocellatus TaxID=433405 RepID=UPI0012EEB8A7|nr:securin-like [Anarrhichthys ocellatus]